VLKWYNDADEWLNEIKEEKATLAFSTISLHKKKTTLLVLDNTTTALPLRKIGTL
jgi:hypothetical protein